MHTTCIRISSEKYLCCSAAAVLGLCCAAGLPGCSAVCCLHTGAAAAALAAAGSPTSAQVPAAPCCLGLCQSHSDSSRSLLHESHFINLCHVAQHTQIASDDEASVVEAKWDPPHSGNACSELISQALRAVIDLRHSTTTRHSCFDRQVGTQDCNACMTHIKLTVLPVVHQRCQLLLESCTSLVIPAA